MPRQAAARRSQHIVTRDQLHHLDDAGVIRAHLRGEPRAFTELHDRYTIRLFNFVYRTIGDREKAEDIVQEVWIRVYRHLHRFDRSKKFSTWAYTIAANLSKNELRDRSRGYGRLVNFSVLERSNISMEQIDPERPLSFEDTRSRPDDMYRRRYLQQLVAETIEKLQDHHRVVFVLREVEGKTYEEIADILHANLGTVKSRLNRARTAFAAIIEPALG